MEFQVIVNNLSLCTQTHRENSSEHIRFFNLKSYQIIQVKPQPQKQKLND